MIEAWSVGKKIDFKYVNSHEKTSAVRDTSRRETLRARIRERLAVSKNCLVILSEKTRKSGSELSYEVEKAVDYYKIPLIITYTGRDVILRPEAHSARWPNTLRYRIENRTAKAIHIAFKQETILDAINQFTVQSHSLSGPVHYYDKKTHIEMGLLRGKIS